MEEDRGKVGVESHYHGIHIDSAEFHYGNYYPVLSFPHPFPGIHTAISNPVVGKMRRERNYIRSFK
jgi:hypothetical protein